MAGVGDLSPKPKPVASAFKLLREDLARKACLACAILWNFWVLATYLFLLFLSGILHYGYAKGCGRFLEQPLPKVDIFNQNPSKTYGYTLLL